MINPVILCGGAGTRLWPLSRKAYPKQFTTIVDPELSLFEAAARRLTGPDFTPPTIVTNGDFRFMVREQLVNAGVTDAQIIIEPTAKNTAPAILAAALVLAKDDPEAVMLVAPSDHVIPDAQAFRAAVRSALSVVHAGKIVTFGIAPTAPETGYGWLETEEGAGIVGLRCFVEKPELAAAQAMLDAGNFLWNAGIFMFKVSTLLAAFKAFAPEMLGPVQASVAEAQKDLGFLRLGPRGWARCPAKSIDFAIMEHAQNLAVVPFRAGWSDLGSWGAVDEALPHDDHGVATLGQVTAIDCEDCLLRSEHAGLELVAIGLKNIIAVAMDDAVLIVDKSKSQDVKAAVDLLRARATPQAESFRYDHRPWGYFESLAVGERFQVKRIIVKPGAALSLQSHVHRAEHWIVVSGTARVTVGDQVSLVSENQSIYIPLGAKHRMENPGKVPMVLIEVQTGAYLGEDDIIRYEDVYARGQGAKG